MFYSAAVLALAKLVRDLMLRETSAPGTWLAGAGAIAALLIVGVAFHRLFSERSDPDEPKYYDFFPGHALTELMIGTGLLGLPTLLCLIFPAEMGEKANPLMTPAHIKPEWYFYFQFRLLKLTSHSATIADTGEVTTFDRRWDEKRNDMKGVCAACHSTSHVEGFYKSYDGLGCSTMRSSRSPGPRS